VTVEDRVAAEALRLNARYVEEVVIGWDLCPWAARAWRDGEVERRVFPSPRPEAAAVAAFVEQIAARPRCSVGLAIFPRVDLPVAAWDRFAEEVRRAGGRDVSADVAQANFATVARRDPARLVALLDDLRRDRDRAYAALA